MREFVKDFTKVCEDYGKFCKKHWKGLAVVNAVLIAGEFVYFYKDTIKDTLEEKFHKGES